MPGNLDSGVPCAGCAHFRARLRSHALRLLPRAFDRPGGVFHLSTPARLPATALVVRMGIPGQADWECAGDCVPSFRGSVRLLVIPIALSAHAGCLPVQPSPAALDAIPSLYPVSDPDLEIGGRPRRLCGFIGPLSIFDFSTAAPAAWR